MSAMWEQFFGAGKDSSSHSGDLQEGQALDLNKKKEEKPSKRELVHTDPNIRAAETKLRRILSTQVKITTGSPGRIEIEYYDLPDLDRIFTLITRSAAAEAHTAM